MRIRHSTLATLLVIPLMVMSSPTKAGAPSVAVAQERTPFIVFFDWDKAVVLAEGTATVGEAAAAFGKFGGGAVRLIGHSDRSGGSAANARLALRRVDAVRALLIEKGVPESAIISQAVGESRPIVPVADGVREAQNRSVEIRLEPPRANDPTRGVSAPTCETQASAPSLTRERRRSVFTTASSARGLSSKGLR